VVVSALHLVAVIGDSYENRLSAFSVFAILRLFRALTRMCPVFSLLCLAHAQPHIPIFSPACLISSVQRSPLCVPARWRRVSVAKSWPQSAPPQRRASRKWWRGRRRVGTTSAKLSVKRRCSGVCAKDARAVSLYRSAPSLCFVVMLLTRGVGVLMAGLDVCSNGAHLCAANGFAGGGHLLCVRHHWVGDVFELQPGGGRRHSVLRPGDGRQLGACQILRLRGNRHLLSLARLVGLICVCFFVSSHSFFSFSSLRRPLCFRSCN
jgi:hypothetical protein